MADKENIIGTGRNSVSNTINVSIPGTVAPADEEDGCFTNQAMEDDNGSGTPHILLTAPKKPSAGANSNGLAHNNDVGGSEAGRTKRDSKLSLIAPNGGALSANSLSVPSKDRMPNNRGGGDDAATSPTESPSTSVGEDDRANMGSRMRGLYKNLSDQARKLTGRPRVPPSPNPSSGSSTLNTPLPPVRRKSLKEEELLNRNSNKRPTEAVGEDYYITVCKKKMRVPRFLKKFRLPSKIDPQGRQYISWLLCVTMAFLYNMWVIPLRGFFLSATNCYPKSLFPDEFAADNCDEFPINCCWDPLQIEQNSQYIWYILDYTCDLVYLLDVFVKMRIKFARGGIYVEDPKELRRHYMSQTVFKSDVLSLLPLELLYFVPALNNNTLLRLPRMCKLYTYWEFTDKCERMLSNAHVFRIVKTLGILLYIIHLDGCMYYTVHVMSIKQAEDITDTIYRTDTILYSPDKTFVFTPYSSYIRSFYWALKTVTAIGNDDGFNGILELSFCLFSYLIGVFIFAIVIGQMRDVVEAAFANRNSFRRHMDETMNYMKLRKIPPHVQRRVRMWYEYLWKTQEMLDERDALGALPVKMRTDLAIHVHMGTLKKVGIFQECDQMLLRDLVLRLIPVLYLPGDYICKKGEVGKEMYIVNHGIVQVVGGESGRDVLATLQPGSVFGEISLLSIGGGNRRTADVMSPGYANLFVLDKKDLQEVLTEYPDAQVALKRKAKKLMQENEKMKRKKSLIQEKILDKKDEPKLLKAIIQVSRPNGITSTILGGNQKPENMESNESTDPADGTDRENVLLIKVREQHDDGLPPDGISIASDEEMELRRLADSVSMYGDIEDNQGAPLRVGLQPPEGGSPSWSDGGRVKSRAKMSDGFSDIMNGSFCIGPSVDDVVTSNRRPSLDISDSISNIIGGSASVDLGPREGESRWTGAARRAQFASRLSTQGSAIHGLSFDITDDPLPPCPSAARRNSVLFGESFDIPHHVEVDPGTWSPTATAGMPLIKMPSADKGRGTGSRPLSNISVNSKGSVGSGTPQTPTINPPTQQHRLSFDTSTPMMLSVDRASVDSSRTFPPDHPNTRNA